MTNGFLAIPHLFPIHKPFYLAKGYDDVDEVMWRESLFMCDVTAYKHYNLALNGLGAF